MLINRERLAKRFTTLCEIDSPSRHERMVAEYLHQELTRLGADSIVIDDTTSQTGSDTGNLVARFNGSGPPESSLFFACHMDTVEPGRGIQVQRDDDIFTSKSNTVLGSDDKSGIAAVLELIAVLREHALPHCPIELIFTTCEEIGLLGAKAFDHTILSSQSGIALDSSHKDTIIIGAPAANRVKVSVTGRAAHSGTNPEAGINALAVTAEALSRIKLGRLDKLSTANFGLIKGGTASNIVPERVTLEGEVRSHSPVLLEKHTVAIRDVFKKVVATWPLPDQGPKELPSLDFEVEDEFPVMALERSEPILLRIQEAAASLGRSLSFDVGGGGSDANIFNSHGLKTAILPTGMSDVHTTDEWVDLSSMVELTELLLAIVRKDAIR